MRVAISADTEFVEQDVRVASVEEHYEDSLSRHYTWMLADHDSLVREYRGFFERNGISPQSLGLTSIPELAPASNYSSSPTLSFEVLAVDTRTTPWKIYAPEPESGRPGRSWARFARPTGVRERRPIRGLAVCGDSLTHPRSFIEKLFGDLRGFLEAGGKPILEFSGTTTRNRTERAGRHRSDWTTIGSWPEVCGVRGRARERAR